MTFNINVGFGDLVNDGKKYALFLGDTILVNEVCLMIKFIMMTIILGRVNLVLTVYGIYIIFM